MKGRLLILFVFVLTLSPIAAIAVYRARESNQPDKGGTIAPAPVRTQTLELQDVELGEVFYGLIRPNAEVDMAFKVAGRVAQLGPDGGAALAEGNAVDGGQLIARLEPVLAESTPDFEVVLVDDCSADESWEVVQRLAGEKPWLSGIHLMRNYGQHNALLCGIRAARHELIVTMDDDLQHPPEELPKLLARQAELAKRAEAEARVER